MRTVYHPAQSDSAVALPFSAHGSACEIALTRRSQKFGGVSFSELTAMQLQQKRQNAKAAWESLPDQLMAYSRILADVRTDSRAAQAAKLPGETRKERTHFIRESREVELAVMTTSVVKDMHVDTPDLESPPQQESSTDEVNLVEKTALLARKLFEARRLANTPPAQP